MNKYLATITLILAVLTQAKAQDFTAYNSYSQNSYIYNPAGVCQDYKLYAYAISNNKWTNFSNSPNYIGVGGYASLSESSSFGVKLNNYQGGSFNESEFALSYGYKFQLIKDHWIALGFSAKGLQRNLDLFDVTVFQSNDPTLESGYYKASSLSFALGVNYAYKGLKFDLVLPRILDVNSALQGSVISYLEYSFELVPKELSVVPGILLNHLNKGETWADFNVRAEYLDRFCIQLSYRSNNNIVAMAGINWNGIAVNYAYERGIGSVANFSSGSHEIQLCYYLSKKHKKMKTILY